MQTIKHKQNGRSLLATVLLIPVLLIGVALAYFVFCEARKAYWDHQVKIMCEKDGGIKVYERMPIPREYIDRDGLIRIRKKPKNPTHPLEFEAKPTDAFYYEWIVEPIKQGHLAVGKSTFRIVRSLDKQVLGVAEIYRRTGGDFPSPAYPSSFVCPVDKSLPQLLDVVFIKP